MTTPSLAAARADVLIKRARLQASVAQAKHRLAPSTIASHVADDLREKAVDGIVAVRERPAAAAGIAAALLAIVIRKPIGRLFHRTPTVPAAPRTSTPPLQGTDS